MNTEVETMGMEAEAGKAVDAGIHSAGLLLGLNKESQVGACVVICREIRHTRRDGSKVRRYEVLTGRRKGVEFEAPEKDVQACFAGVPVICSGCRLAHWKGNIWPAAAEAKGQDYLCHACRMARLHDRKQEARR